MKKIAWSFMRAFVLSAFAAASFSGPASAEAGSTSNASTFVIPGNTPAFISQAKDLGAVDPSTVITVTAWLKLQNQMQLDALVQQQQRKGSPNYRKWITQDQFNASFGATSKEANAVQNFLKAKNLTIDVVAENNMYVRAYGTVQDVQAAFHVSIHNYSFAGKTYRSNSADPSINDASGAFIAAILGMEDYGFEPQIILRSGFDGTPAAGIPLSEIAPDGLFFEGQAFRPPEMDTFIGGGNTATYTGNRYGADITNTNLGHLPPQGYSVDEVQTAYNLKPLYQASLDGSGQTIVIVDAYGSPTIAQDAAVFSQIYGLPPVNLQIVNSPGLLNKTSTAAQIWAEETTLDVEWAHAIAPGAKIALVIATNPFDRNRTGQLSPLIEAINYAVVHHLGNTISNSWGLIEYFFTPAALYEGERVFQMAAVQGIDVNFATGDYGDEAVIFGFTAVSYPASSPYVTAIGGTSLALNPDNSIMFQTGWGNNATLITDVSPSGGAIADDNPPLIPPVEFGFIFGSGGGLSHNFAKPSFQSGLPGTRRLVPDISWLADPLTGVETIITINGQLFVQTAGGTSLACPMFSGLMAIAAQKAGHGLGQAAPLVNNLTASAVTDIVPVGSPDNVTGVVSGLINTSYSADFLAAPLNGTTTYFSALWDSPFFDQWFVLTFGTDSSLKVTPGWDNVTGVGTPNGMNFINAITQ
jgi:subtilase family serine protease